MMTYDEFQVRFDEALRLSREGLHDQAVHELKRLLHSGHHAAAVTKMLGLILQYDVGDSVAALPFLRQSVAMSPNSEKSSLGLFHALLATNQVDEAFDEARRYLREHESAAYDEFMHDVLKK